MNMIGHPKHVQKCLDAGADIICAQGGEGGGHTGDVPTTILIPTVVKMVQGKKSPMTGQPVQVIAAGGLFNGQSVAAALMLGATAVWIGTRFILSDEAGAPKAHQEAVRTSGFDDNVRTIIFTVSGDILRIARQPLDFRANSASRDDHSAFATTHISKTGRRTALLRSRNLLKRVSSPSKTTSRSSTTMSTTRLWTMPAHG